MGVGGDLEPETPNQDFLPLAGPTGTGTAFDEEAALASFGRDGVGGSMTTAGGFGAEEFDAMATGCESEEAASPCATGSEEPASSVGVSAEVAF